MYISISDNYGTSQNCQGTPYSLFCNPWIFFDWLNFCYGRIFRVKFIIPIVQIKITLFPMRTLTVFFSSFRFFFLLFFTFENMFAMLILAFERYWVCTSALSRVWLLQNKLYKIYEKCTNKKVYEERQNLSPHIENSVNMPLCTPTFSTILQCVTFSSSLCFFHYRAIQLLWLNSNIILFELAENWQTRRSNFVQSSE